MDNSLINIDLLPTNLRFIAEHIGLPTCIKLVENYGGTRVWVPVPEKLKTNNHLVRNLGQDAAIKFCQHYGLEYVMIDKADRALRAIRDQQILEQLAEDQTVASVARHFGLTERQVYNIKRVSEGERLADAQVELW